MATFGKGELKGRELLVVCDDRYVTRGKDASGKEVVTGYYVDVSLNQSNLPVDKVRSGEITADHRPHLVNRMESFVDTDEKTGENVERKYIDHRAWYSASQVEQMKAAAGPKSSKPNHNTTVLGIVGDVWINDKKEVLVKTKGEMKPTELPFGRNILTLQENVRQAAIDCYKEKQAEQSAEKAAETPAKKPSKAKAAKPKAPKEPAVEAPEAEDEAVFG